MKLLKRLQWLEAWLRSEVCMNPYFNLHFKHCLPRPPSALHRSLFLKCAALVLRLPRGVAACGLEVLQRVAGASPPHAQDSIICRISTGYVSHLDLRCLLSMAIINYVLCLAGKECLQCAE